MRVHTLIASTVLALFSLAADSDAASQRSFVGGNYVVEVAGANGGYVSQVSAGGMSATVVVDRAGAPGVYPKKHLAGSQFDDITFTVAAPEAPMSNWIKAAVNSAQPQKRDGAIIATDANFKEMSRVTWKDGTLTDITFPELDASAAKKRWEIQVTVTPSVVAYAAGAGAPVPVGVASKAKVAMMSSNFRMGIPGLDLKRVFRVEELSVRYRVVTSTSNVGDGRLPYEKTPGAVDVSNLAFELPEADAPQIYAWYQAFVKSGGADKEKKTATIELLSPKLDAVMGTITLGGVGISKVTLTGASASDAVRRVRAEAFVESVQVDFR